VAGDHTPSLRAIHFSITGWQVYTSAEWRIRLALIVRQLPAVLEVY